MSTDLSTYPLEEQPESEDPADVDPRRPNQLLSPEELGLLNSRSNLKGTIQLAGHLAILGGSGYLWATHLEHWPLALPALVIYGFSFASMFATLHECSHRTAFSNQRVNDIVCWFAGVLSFYNSTFYRRYHKWHHRYTQIPGKDPELSDPKPTTLWEYVLEISGWHWWIGKFRGHFRVATGQLEDCPFIPEAARPEVIRSLRLQLLVYALGIGISIAVQQPWFVLYWMLPLAVGQPILRMILLAEHTGCSQDDNPLTNTRTTLTLWPLRFLMWNMPFHAEHHLYASIPFHALPAAHTKLLPHLTQVESGYLKAQSTILSQFEEVVA